MIGTDLTGISFKHLEDLERINLTEEEKGISINIGWVSEGVRTILGLSELSFSRRRPTLSIRVEGINLERHEMAVKAIERTANSFLFQIELQTDLGLYIAPTQGRVKRRNPAFGHRTDSITLKFPDVEYDQEPLSLYWYSQVAETMPVLQYLALYQTIEHFFPVYSDRDAQRVLTKTVKDPTFNFDKSTDVAKLLKALRISGRGGYGSERNQLASVIEHCVEEDEFFEGSEDRKEFFREKRRYSSVSQVKIPVTASDGTMARLLAERMYDIRCRIFHAKAEQNEEVSVNLPFSKTAQSLAHDIDLARFIARKTLVSSGNRLVV